jgi:hypothetical protein
MSDNPYMKRAAARAPGSHGNVSEKRLAKSLGAKLQPASGALKSCKSDMKLKAGGYKFRSEAKSTVKDTLPVDLGWLTKIASEASSSGDIPMLTLSFVTPEGKPRTDRNSEWVCIPKVFFQEMLDELA